MERLVNQSQILGWWHKYICKNWKLNVSQKLDIDDDFYYYVCDNEEEKLYNAST
jgi:hypothetical protein